MKQLPVQRKMLTLKRSHRSNPGKILSVVEYWTSQGKRSDGRIARSSAMVELRAPRVGFERLGKTRADPGQCSRHCRHHSSLEGRAAQVESRVGLFPHVSWTRKRRRRECRARERRTYVRALGNGCATPNPAVNARVEEFAR